MNPASLKTGRKVGWWRLPVFLGLFLLYFLYSMFLLLNPTDAKSNSFENGKMVWQKYNCQSCHQIYGLGGYLGPDLTNVYQKGGEAYIRGMVQSGTDVMPAFKMSNSELDALEIYFKNMNQSGVSDPREFVVEYDGFIRLK